MKKKLLLALLSISMMIACAIGLAACGGNSIGRGAHEHTYASEWSSNSTHHWHAAICEHTDEVKDKQPHTSAVAVQENEVSATCTTGGGYDEVIYCPVCHYEISRVHNTTDATDHSYGDPMWMWDEFTSATATFTCANDSTHVEKVTATITSKDTIPATCTSMGVRTYTATVTFGGQTYTDAETESIPFAEHVFSEKWIYDNQSHWQTCTICGETGEKENHDFVKGVCSECGIRQSGTGLAYYYDTGSESYNVLDIGICTDTDITILSEFSGIPVTKICDGAFENCRFITSVTIPAGVADIGRDAFKNCTSLESVTIPSSVISIGRDAFNNCLALSEVYITDIAAWCNIDFIEGTSNPLLYAPNLYLNNKLVTDLTIPVGVTNIGAFAFYCCNSLKSITIPAGVIDIGWDAFSGCSSLKSIAIPAGVTEIKNRTFKDCSSLTSITIPAGVTSIGEEAFQGCSMLTNITIPASVIDIGWYAFSDCSALTSIIIPDGVTSIEAGVFSSCSALKTVTFGEKSQLVGIGDAAYEGCSALMSVTIPDSVTSINYRAFYDCISLTSITIPVGVTSIEGNAFYGCTKLVEVYNKSSLPLTIGSINNGYVAYYAANIYTENGMSWFTDTKDGYRYFYNKEKDASYLMGYYGTEAIISLPESFQAYNGDIKTEYGIFPSAFSYCVDLKSVTIPDSVTSIGINAFYNCSGLTSITIPDSVTSIGGSAFYGCNALTIYCEAADNVGWGGNWNSNDRNNACPVVWNCKTNETAGDGNIYTVIDGIRYALKDGVAAVVGQPTNIYGSITIPSSVTYKGVSYSVASIGYRAFYGCNSLTNITFPDSVTSIGEDAFYDCSSLTSIVIPDDVTSIGAYAFYGCRSLKTDIIIPDGVTSIGESAFQDCSSLTSIAIPDGVTSIGEYAFEGCSALKTVTFGQNSRLPSIGEYAFSVCYNLTSIAIPDSVTSIERSAFSGCSALKTVTFGKNSQLTSIGYSVFSYCSSLTSMIVPDSVTSIENYAFSNCYGLTVYYGGTAEEWSAINIGSSNTPLTSATVYYYSDNLTEEQKADGNNYWHYVNGVPTIWIKETT